MKDILVLGAGKIGCIISKLLASSGDYLVTVADMEQANLDALPSHDHIDALQLDVTNKAELLKVLAGKYAALSACPFQITRHIAEAATLAKVHYLDLTEDVATTQFVKKLSVNSESALVPQCGLAPGFISIVGYELTKQFDELRNVHLRVGALPRYPSNALKYNLTWSTSGLINEYCNPCEAIVEGKLKQVSPLEELEAFSLDGVNYEAFNTSGGLGTLSETLANKVTNLNYRTIRYPGHRDIMKILLQDLQLCNRRELLKEIFEQSLPGTSQDVVLIFVNVTGKKNGRLVQETYANKIYNQIIDDIPYTAIQVTTATSICTVLDLLATGKIAEKGFVRQESIDFNDFINNRFGRYYAKSTDQIPVSNAA